MKRRLPRSPRSLLSPRGLLQVYLRCRYNEMASLPAPPPLQGKVVVSLEKHHIDLDSCRIHWMFQKPKLGSVLVTDPGAFYSGAELR